jgi:hypothetical protein
MSYWFFSLFSSAKSENRRQSCLRGKVGTHGRGKVVRKGGRKVNIVQKMYTHACNCNNDTTCNYSMNWGEGVKRERWKG